MRREDRRQFLRDLAKAGSSAVLAPWIAVAAGTITIGATLPGQAIAADEHGTGPKGTPNGQTKSLAVFASSLRYEDIPAAVLQRARDAITDTVATCTYGAQLPWSRIVTAYARANGSGGISRILGVSGATAHPPSAALCNGSFAHAFELDNLTKPNSGSHPGATVFTAGLAVGQDRNVSGRDLITAFVAGVEVMIRIGRATRHSQEQHGFHAPGTTGPFGAAVVCSKLLGLTAAQTQNALGIAASTASGLLEFAKSGTGAMVKRLHMGRASEAGVMAALLAADGFTGPETALEGEFGFLKVFCRDYDMDALTEGLGQTWLTETIMMKRYAAHITAHTPVQGTLALKNAHGFSGDDVEAIDIQAIDRAVRVNNIPQPKDILLAQYSIPFCVALALYRNPVDPRSFDESAVADPRIMGLAQRITMRALPPPDNRSDMTSVVTITLKDGRSFSERTTTFMGTPEQPMTQDQLREKFLMLTREFGEANMATMFDRLQNLQDQKSIEWIGV